MASDLEPNTTTKETSHTRPPLPTPTTSAKGGSSLATSAYRTLRNITRLGSGVVSVSRARDASVVNDGDADDMDFGGDVSSDDYDSSEHDQDDCSIASWHSDDESVHSDGENDSAQDEIAADDSRHRAFKARFKLPTIRPASIDNNWRKKVEAVDQTIEIVPPNPAADTTPRAATELIQSAPPKNAAETGVQIPQYKIVKVRKPDGTVVNVKRRIKPAQVPAQIKPEGDIARPEADEVKVDDSKDQSSKPQLERLQEQTKTGTEKKSGESEKLQKEVQQKGTVHELEKGNKNSQHGLRPPNKVAQSLERRTSKFAQIIIWTIMILFPLLFIVIGIITAVVTGRPEDSPLGIGITQASRISVSLWPIVFAALLTQALRMYASYKVERGLRLMTLEQLMGSHSVANAIKQPFLLQRFNWTSLALLCLWCLSPLAGQALLRMSYVDFDGSVHNVTLQYINTTGSPVAFEGAASIDAFAPELDALLGASILAPIATQQSPMDTWGNTKIPILENLTTNDADEWLIVEDSPSYSSLVGVPVRGLADGGNASFSITSAYITFDCPALTQTTMDEANATVFQNSGLQLSGLAVLKMAVLPPSGNQPGILYFAALRPVANGSVAYTACNLAQSFVESLVSCTGTQCAVGAMRPASGLSTALSEINLVTCILHFVVSGAATETSDIYPDTLFYINDPASAGTNNFAEEPDILNVPIANFTARLSVLVNTYWQSGIAPWFITGQLNTSSAGTTLLNASAIETSTALVYHTSWAWLTVLLVSGVVLLVGGVVGAICDSHTVGPDIFGFASSLAHRNKYIRVPTGEDSGTGGTTGGGMVGGPQSARMLGHLMVMLQDVRADAEVGRIVLGTMDNGGKRLRQGRVYR